MSMLVQATDSGTDRFAALLKRGVEQEGTEAIGMAVAYVSVQGFTFAKSLMTKNGISDIRMVTDISDCVTHPNALEFALESGWRVRVVDAESTFHPKFYVGGHHFDKMESLVRPSFVIVSSGNLSYSALNRNAECSYINTSGASSSSVATWSKLWGIGEPATAKIIFDYRKSFSERNKHRPIRDLRTLGITDAPLSGAKDASGKKISPPPDDQKAISKEGASAAWAGLETITGDYTLQVEFPRKAAIVMKRLLPSLVGGGGVELVCADGITRKFTFSFYGDNGMFRLNIPNDTPNAVWARANRIGIALVEADSIGVLHFRILLPGNALDNAIEHSVALGTWGRTPTRLYGWY
jgi:hypothetical protein